MGNGFGLRKQRLHSGLACGVVGVTHVEAHMHCARDHVARIRFHIYMAHGGDQSFRALRERFHRDDPLCRAGQRIAAQMHRRGAGMIGVSGPRESVPRLAHDGSHSGNAQILRLENRTLFDVNLEEAQRVVTDCRLFDLSGIEPEGANRVLERDAVCIFQLEQGSDRIARLPRGCR